MHLNDIADKHFQWVESMGWHNKSPLEYIALIASEIGEAANECRGHVPTDKLGSELADIILRTIDLALIQGIDIEEAILSKMQKNNINGTRGRLV